MDDLFKRGKFTIVIPVQGETNNYEVKIITTGFLEELHKQMAISKNFDLKTVTKTLTSCFDRDDVFIYCTCPDFCLEENTKIKLLNNEVKTVKELKEMFDNGKELWVYSTDAQGDFQPGKVDDVWVSGYVQDMIKVFLDNGEYIITTPNHRYMLRDGRYEEAQNLTVGQSLMPLYFKINDKGYEDVKINSTTYPTKFESVYKRVANDVLAEEVESVTNRAEDSQVQIHHMDFNKLNNYPSNLKPMGRLEHWRYHCDIARDTERFKKWKEAGEEYRKLVEDHSTEEYKKQFEVYKKGLGKYQSEHTVEEMVAHRKELGAYGEEWKKKISDSQKALWENYTEEEYQHRCDIHRASNNNPETKQKQSDARKAYYQNHPEHYEKVRKNLSKGAESVRGIPKSEKTKERMRQTRLNESEETKQSRLLKTKLVMAQKSPEELELKKKRQVDSRILNAIKSIYAEGGELTEESYAPYKKKGAPDIIKKFGSIEATKQYFGIGENFNHKIVSVEKIHYDEPIPVYDISVAKYNNFYVDAGVILHNCYRFQYWSTRNKYNSGPPQNSNGKRIRNPNDTLGSTCKHGLLVLSNNSWILPCGRVIVNYVEWMKQHKEQMYAEQIYPAIYEQDYEDAMQYDMLAKDELAKGAGDDDEIKAGNIHKGRDAQGRFTSDQEPGQFRKNNQSNKPQNNKQNNQQNDNQEETQQ